jgi:hypothetical protein
MNSNERMQQREQQEDKEDKLLIKFLGPNQLKLFHLLATDYLRDPPNTTKFMKGILRLQSPMRRQTKSSWPCKTDLVQFPYGAFTGSSPVDLYPERTTWQSRVDYSSYSTVQKDQARDPPPFTRTKHAYEYTWDWMWMRI